MEVKNNDGKVLYHVQSLTDWHEPCDIFVFANHEPDTLELRALIAQDLGLDENEDVEAIDDFVECARAYTVYPETI